MDCRNNATGARPGLGGALPALIAIVLVRMTAQVSA